MRKQIAVAVLAVTCAAVAQQRSPAPSKNGLSPKFKMAAWRALDALFRMTGPFSSDNDTPAEDALVVEADKAVSEAKYVAATSRDLYVLHALQMAVISFRGQLARPMSDSEWNTYTKRFTYCEAEARYYIDPDTLSESGKQMAELGVCNKETVYWGTGITR